MKVSQQQSLLYYLGYYELKNSKGDIVLDEIPGRAMREAVLNFQADHYIQQTGEVDSVTEEALKVAVANEEPIPEEKPDMPPLEVDDDDLAAPGKESWWKEIKWFKPEEFACKCKQFGPAHCDGWPARMCKTTVKLADRARDYFGVPGDVSSGLRDPIHNKNSHGVWNSLHQTGEACDIAFRGKTPAEVKAFFDKQPEVVYSYCIKNKEGQLTGYVHYNIARGAK